MTLSVEHKTIDPTIKQISPEGQSLIKLPDAKEFGFKKDTHQKMIFNIFVLARQRKEKVFISQIVKAIYAKEPEPKSTPGIKKQARNALTAAHTVKDRVEETSEWTIVINYNLVNKKRVESLELMTKEEAFLNKNGNEK